MFIDPFRGWPRDGRAFLWTQKVALLASTPSRLVFGMQQAPVHTSGHGTVSNPECQHPTAKPSFGGSKRGLSPNAHHRSWGWWTAGGRQGDPRGTMARLRGDSTERQRVGEGWRKNGGGRELFGEGWSSPGKGWCGWCRPRQRGTRSTTTATESRHMRHCGNRKRAHRK